MAAVSKWSFALPGSRERLSPQILIAIDGVVLAWDTGVYRFVVDAG